LTTASRPRRFRRRAQGLFSTKLRFREAHSFPPEVMDACDHRRDFYRD
jgi:hypothetical protein